MNAVAGTGHRPGDRFPADQETFDHLFAVAWDWILDEQPSVILTGMALGWDQALAKAAIEHGVPVVAYIPFIGQADRWSKRQAEDYSNLLNQCAEKKLISRSYRPGAFQRRNEAMVDDANKIVALWDGSPGGTANCIEYAEVMGVPVENLWKTFQP